MKQSKKGIALILALLVLTILIVLVAQMSFTSTQNRIIAKNYNNDLQNTYGVRSGYYYALLFLQDDLEKAPEVDHLGEDWAKSINLNLGNAQTTITIEDARSKLNLSYLTDPNSPVRTQLKRLIINLGYEEKYVEIIGDYIDTNTKGDYEVGAKNNMLYNIEELLRVDGLKQEILYGETLEGIKKKGIIEFITTIQTLEQLAQVKGIKPPSSQVWHININTAPSEILLSLSDNLTADIVENIIFYRQQVDEQGKQKAFKNVDELKNVQSVTNELFNEIRPFLTVRSNYYNIKSFSRAWNVEKGWAYTVYKDAQTKRIRLLTSHRINDFLKIIKPSEEK